ncbi:hypothetical protein K474DRAFT_251154 [Panus rudis PR-1116 ss-1]|nr:hypothetical protein K474DRAFT_251154 [Panus rudis PR-1116 ss-1]
MIQRLQLGICFRHFNDFILGLRLANPCPAVAGGRVLSGRKTSRSTAYLLGTRGDDSSILLTLQMKGITCQWCPIGHRRQHMELVLLMGMVEVARTKRGHGHTPVISVLPKRTNSLDRLGKHSVRLALLSNPGPQDWLICFAMTRTNTEKSMNRDGSSITNTASIRRPP